MANQVIVWQPGITLAVLEKEIITACMRYFSGNKSATAIALGVTTRTIDNKLSKYREEEERNKKQKAEHKRIKDETLAEMRRGNVAKI